MCIYAHLHNLTKQKHGVVESDSPGDFYVYIKSSLLKKGTGCFWELSLYKDYTLQLAV